MQSRWLVSIGNYPFEEKEKEKSTPINDKQKSYAMAEPMEKNYKFRSILELNENICSWIQYKGCLCVWGEPFMATDFSDKYTSNIHPCGYK